VDKSIETHVALLVLSNDIGKALYEKSGFETEGTHRRYAFRDGGFVDAYSMARLKG
jgi:putative acetyltransferase